MIPIANNVPAGTERGVSALLELISNPKRAGDAKATLDELIRVRDEADAALAKANALNAELAKRTKELEVRESALENDRTHFDTASRALSSAEAKHTRAVSQFEVDSAATRTDLSARAVAIASAEQAIARRETDLNGRETAIAAKEQAAQSLKSEYESKLAKLKSLTG